ncbi:MAG: type VI secretion system baseplate subunit TssG [Planctomycetota bacterium]|jgi:type VI secretion system protein ImpH
MNESPDQVNAISNRLRGRLTLVQFVQFLRCLQRESGTRIGDVVPLSSQPVRLVPDVEPAFPVSELSWWKEAASDAARPTLAVNFFGLFGPCGVLPNHYSQLIQERLAKKDRALLEFLNIFNHRILCMFYQAWEKHAFAVSMETAAASDKKATVTEALWAIVGNRLETSRELLAFDDSSILYYGGLFANKRATQESLRSAVEDFTRIPTDIENLVGQWLRLAPEDQSRIGSFALGEKAGNCLGVDTLVGEIAWSIESRFRIRLGPVAWDVLGEYLPTGTMLRSVVDFARRYVGPQYDFDIQIVVAADQVRGIQLDPQQPFLLGWNTWLGTWENSNDAEQAILELPDIAMAT